MLIGLASLVILVLSIYSHFNYGKDPKHCDGNFIAPSYQNVPITSDFAGIRPLASKYTLKRHYEERDERIGIPCLFLAGNAGSFDQARSFGTVAFRINRWYGGRPFQLYTVDTKGELSAFNDKAIVDQALFANECVKVILDSYHGNFKPTSVLIIGHSMGGIVARMMPLLDNYRNQSVEDIITLSTPHKEVPLPLQRQMTSMMAKLNYQWRLKHGVAETQLENITLTSIAGGNRDTVLDSILVNPMGIGNKNLTRFYHTSGMSKVWTGGDHEASTWCDQLLQQLAIVAAKLSSVIEINPAKRMKLIETTLDPQQNIASNLELTKAK